MTRLLAVHQMRWVVCSAVLLWSGLAQCEETEWFGCCTLEGEGRIEYDYNRYYNDVADLGDGDDVLTDVRRAEIGLAGTINTDFDWAANKHLEWAAGYDFKARVTTDAYLKYSTGKAWHVRAGKFKQPLGLEELSSARTGDFISKAAVTNMLALARQIGFAYDHSFANAGITASVFGRTRFEEDRATDPDSGYVLRGYWTPLRKPGQVLHLGIAHAGFNTHEDEVRLRARPNADLTAVRLVDTGILDNASGQSSMGLELLWLSAGMKLEAEFMQTTVRRDAGQRDFTGRGAYVSGVWNLTGEAWTYRNGVPVTPKAKQPRRGLWQAGVRYDWIDLDDGQVLPPAAPGAGNTVDGTLGGSMDIWTAGVSVYWRSHIKLMLNYVSVSSDRYDPAQGIRVRDDPDILEGRVQVYW